MVPTGSPFIEQAASAEAAKQVSYDTLSAPLAPLKRAVEQKYSGLIESLYTGGD
jgi:hypothetical protein